LLRHIRFLMFFGARFRGCDRPRHDPYCTAAGPSARHVAVREVPRAAGAVNSR
jgi:hypothetical protein